MGVVSVLLLVKWGHSELLMRQGLVFSARWSLLLGTWPRQRTLLSWLDSNETVTFYKLKFKID